MWRKNNFYSASRDLLTNENVMCVDILKHFSDTPEQLILWSFRYFLGRKSVSASRFARDLANAWKDLSDNTQNIISQELETFFRFNNNPSSKVEIEPWQIVRSQYKHQE